MANPTKKLAVHSNPTATVRVYMDLTSETNLALEQLAVAQGRTKKGQLEFLIRDALAAFRAIDAETTKREKVSKKGRK